MFGPAHRWLVANLATLCKRDVGTAKGKARTKR